MSKLTYLGHACFLIETQEAACLIDPWLTPKGAFLGAWRQLPPNYSKLDWLIAKMKEKPILIYITHEHEDHFDEETLEKLAPLASRICIPDYESTFFRKKLSASLEIEPELIGENENQKFHDIEFKIFIDESGINRDSAIFVKAGSLKFFDCNDCKIFDRAHWLKAQCGEIDILSSQFSGANMHPICYELPKEEYKKISRQKKMRKFQAARNFINDLAPRFYLPSAGPAIFPYPEHYHLNFEADNIFPKWWEFEAYLTEKKSGIQFVALDVGGSAESGADGNLNFMGLGRIHNEQELNEMIQQYRDFDKTQELSGNQAEGEIIAFFEQEMEQKVRVLRDNPLTPLSCSVYFEIQGDGDRAYFYKIDASDLSFSRIEPPKEREAPYYHHRATIKLLGMFRNSKRGWGTYFLSFLFRNQREPDVFDSVLSTFFVANDTEELQYGLSKLAQFRNSDEQITLTSGDGKSSVTCKRYCPHQGADLKYAKFDGRHVVCPRHQWRFDCEKGGVADNSLDSICATIQKDKKESHG